MATRDKIKDRDGDVKDPVLSLEPRLVACENKDEMEKKLVEFIDEMMDLMSGEQGGISIGVSGGSMPQLLSKALLASSKMDWKRVRLFMVDERYVQLTHPDSNYGQWKACLPEKLHDVLLATPIADTLQETAAQYQDLLRKEMLPEIIGKAGYQIPRFDILFLGIGPDGHTCSLFPGHKLLKQWDHVPYVMAIDDSPKPPPCRVTLTLNALNAGKHVAFIATGAEKAPHVKAIVNRDTTLPCAMVLPMSGDLRLFVDKAASAQL